MLERLCLVLLWLPTLSLAQGDYFKTRRMIHPGAPGPWVQSSKGEVWPMPKLIKYNKERFLVLDPASFEFRVMHELKFMNLSNQILSSVASRAP